MLLVSYSGSALSDCFRSATQVAIKYGDKRVLDEEISLEVEELLTRGDQISEVLGGLIIQKKDISFQDMKSAHRAFNKYFGIEIEKDERVNNIILGQACRHVIVHEGAKVNARILKQVSGAKPRKLKEVLKESEQLNFTVDEIEMLGSYMKGYVSDLEKKILIYHDLLQAREQPENQQGQSH